jgi:hypothetical protein
MTARPKTCLPKRTWCYLRHPDHFEVAPCPCGNRDTQWSEFKDHLWCAKCAKDFIPAHNGVFDGPILAQTAELIGFDFDRLVLKGARVERWDCKRLKWVREEPA